MADRPPVDLRAIAASLWLPLLFWLGAVLLISLAGYPGVICMTPLAWLLALPTGVRCVLNSRSDGTRALLREAALAGGGLGLIEGVLFILATALTAGATPEGRWRMAEIGLALTVFGAPACAGLAVASAALRLRQPR
jgi:hypothetical protein